MSENKRSGWVISWITASGIEVEEHVEESGKICPCGRVAVTWTIPGINVLENRYCPEHVVRLSQLIRRRMEMAERIRTIFGD